MTLLPEAVKQLMVYNWPGNVRELENVIERAVVLSKGNTIAVTDLPEPITRAEQQAQELIFSIGTPLNEIESRVIRTTLEHTNGDKRLAAQLLGIATRTIYRKLEAERSTESE
jgi:two-component system response regulator HydG